MPVRLHRGPSGQEILKRANGLDSGARGIHIGLLNNMPDAALKSTERQFLTLIDSAAGGIDVRLTLYALPGIPRTDSGRHHVSSFYSGIDSLLNSHLDGLIVTGTEPRTSNLAEEPYWDNMVRVIEWAEQNTNSTVFSCLSAHAAVLHLDGIQRKRLKDKRLGLFECSRVRDHALTGGIPSCFRMPHSRWNGISGTELSECNYLVLTRANDASVNMFVKQKKSLLVFFQGHPEYETNSLLLEYRRDVGRYVRREVATYPQIPCGYFDAETASILTTLQERIVSDRRPGLLADFPISRLETTLTNAWRPAATCIYANWLSYLCAQKNTGNRAYAMVF